MRWDELNAMVGITRNKVTFQRKRKERIRKVQGRGKEKERKRKGNGREKERKRKNLRKGNKKRKEKEPRCKFRFYCTSVCRQLKLKGRTWKPIPEKIDEPIFLMILWRVFHDQRHDRILTVKGRS